MIRTTSSRKASFFGVLAFATVGILLFFEPITRAARGWFTFDGSHGLLIFGIAIYLIWIRGRKLRQIPLKPHLLWGTLSLLLSCVVYLGARWSSTLLLEQLSLVLVLLATTTLTLGSRGLKILSLPILYLSFTFSAFHELFLPISTHLQLITARIASALLSLAGLPVLLSDQYIVLPHITLFVARECNGSNHIIALLALAIPLAFLTQETWLRRSCLILGALLVGLFSNGLRVMLIGLWSVNHKADRLHGPFNLFYVSFILFFGMLLLLGATLLTARRSSSRGPRHAARSVQSSSPNLVEATIDGRVSNRWSKVLPPLIALMLLSLTLALAVFREPSPIFLAQAPTGTQIAPDGWRLEVDVHYPRGPFEQIKADEEFRLTYRDDSDRKVHVYIGYFAAQRQDREIISDSVQWQVQDGSNIPVSLTSGRDTVRKIYFRNDTETGDLYYFYLINGRTLTSRYAAKLATMLDAILRGQTNGAIVAVFVERSPTANPLTQDEVVQFLGRLIPSIRAFIPKQRTG